MNEIIITIIMDGGLIQSVEGVPPGIRVQIIDFDVEGADQESVTTLASGAQAVVTEYEAEVDSPPTA